jgi:hypothetical protein
MSRYLIVCLLILCPVCYAGELKYDPPEEIYSASSLVLIARQVWEISNEPGPAGWKFGTSNFEVIKVIKGTYAQKAIRVMAASRHDFSPGLEPYLSEKLLFISVDNFDHKRGIWYARGAPWGLKEFDPKYSSDFEKNALKALARVQKVQSEALAELENFDSDILKRARELRPKLVEAQASTAAHPTDYFLKSVCDATLATEPWRALSKENPLTLRALQILGYLEPRLSGLDSAVSRRIVSCSDEDERIILKWFKHHYPDIPPADLEQYFRARKQDVISFCLSFPQRKIVPETSDNPDDRIPAKTETTIDPSLNATMRLLIQSDDPGLYEFVMTPGWAFFSSSPTGEKLKQLYAPLRMEWLKPKLLEWARPDSDNRLRQVALIALGENPTPWLREWIEAQRKTLPKDLLSTLVPAAVGLDDEALLFDIWKQIIDQDGSEWNFLWWLRFTRTFSPKLAAFAIKRWKLAEAQTAKDHQNHDQGYGAWLELYAYKLDLVNGKNDPSDRKRFENASEAEDWFSKNR